MVCLQCGSETRVTNSRLQKRNNSVWRRRQCQNCGAIISTQESPLYDNSWRVLSHKGRLQPFSRDKLLISLHESLKHRKTAYKDAGGLVETVVVKLGAHVRGGSLDRRQIIHTVQVALNRFDKAASVHYAAHHQS